MKRIAALLSLILLAWLVARLARRRDMRVAPWYSWDWPEGSTVPWYYAAAVEAARSDDDGWGLFT